MRMTAAMYCIVYASTTRFFHRVAGCTVRNAFKYPSHEVSHATMRRVSTYVALRVFEDSSPAWRVLSTPWRLHATDNVHEQPFSPTVNVDTSNCAFSFHSSLSSAWSLRSWRGTCLGRHQSNDRCVSVGCSSVILHIFMACRARGCPLRTA